MRFEFLVCTGLFIDLLKLAVVCAVHENNIVMLLVMKIVLNDVKDNNQL